MARKIPPKVDDNKFIRHVHPNSANPLIPELLTTSPNSSRHDISALLEPLPSRIPGSFLRIYDTHYLGKLAVKAASEFIPELGDDFLKELVQAQKTFKPDPTVQGQLQRLERTAVTSYLKAVSLLQRYQSSTNPQEKIRLKNEYDIETKNSSDARNEQWSRYNTSRVKSTKELATRFQSKNPQLAESIKTACEVEQLEIDWINKSRKFDEKTLSLTDSHDQYTQALSNFNEYIRWFEDLLSKAIKLKPDEVTKEIDAVKNDFQEVVDIIRTEQTLRLVLQEMVYYASLTNLYQLKDDPNDQYANVIIGTLISPYSGKEFIRDYLKADPESNLDKIAEQFKGKLLSDPKEIDKLIDWIFNKLNTTKFTGEGNSQSIDCNRDFQEALINRISNRFLSIPSEDVKKKILSKGFEIDSITTDTQSKISQTLIKNFENDDQLKGLLDVIDEKIRTAVNDYYIAHRSLRNYVEEHSIPRALYKKGILKTRIGGAQSDVLLGTIIPNQKKQISELGQETIRPTTIHRIVSTHGTAMPNIIENKDGVVFVSQENLFMETAVSFAQAKLWQEDFTKQFQDPKFDLVENPLNLTNYFSAYLVDQSKDSSGKPSREVYRENYLESLMTEQIALSQTNSFLDSCAYSAMPPNLFWGARSVAKADFIGNLLKDNSKVKEFFTEQKERFDDAVADDASVAESKNYNTLLQAFVRLEAILRSLSVSEDPSQVLADAFSGVIFPNRNQESTNSNSNFDYLAQVMLTQLLTKELIGSGIYDSVDWKKLYAGKFELENKEFATNWNNYKTGKLNKHSEIYPLMHLRNSWYSFIKNNMGNFDKMKSFMHSGKIQEAAKRILAREFKTYNQRDNEFTDWKEVFSKNLELVA
jgi:hypothetical protein